MPSAEHTIVKLSIGPLPNKQSLAISQLHAITLYVSAMQVGESGDWERQEGYCCYDPEFFAYVTLCCGENEVPNEALRVSCCSNRYSLRACLLIVH